MMFDGIVCMRHPMCLFFFFNDTATTEIYTLSLHDALPILIVSEWLKIGAPSLEGVQWKGTVHHMGFENQQRESVNPDRKSTRLNSSHANISYAVFCLKKKTTPIPRTSSCSLRATSRPCRPR